MAEVYSNNRQLGRYELFMDGQVAAWVDYEAGEGVIALNHTEVLPAFRGRGLAGDIVAFALVHAQLEQRRVLPRCSFVASFIRRNAEYGDLVA